MLPQQRSQLSGLGGPPEQNSRRLSQPMTTRTVACHLMGWLGLRA
jgi:hypothetical protein